MPRAIGRKYVTVDIDGAARIVWSAELSKAGDLLIFLHSTGRYLDDRNQAPSELHDRTINQQRYSVHVSPSMPEMNMIKHTVEANGKQITTSHFTRAIKRTDRYAPLLSRLVRHTLEPTKATLATKSHSLGRYEPDRYTLYFSLFVGSADRQFLYPPEFSFRVKTLTFGRFSLVMLYSFISMPAGKGMTSHFLTHDPGLMTDDERRSEMEMFMNGLTEPQAVGLFFESGKALIDKLAGEALLDRETPSSAHEVLSLRDFWPEGYRGSTSWEILVQRYGLAYGHKN